MSFNIPHEKCYVDAKAFRSSSNSLIEDNTGKTLLLENRKMKLFFGIANVFFFQAHNHFSAERFRVPLPLKIATESPAWSHFLQEGKWTIVSIDDPSSASVRVIT